MPPASAPPTDVSRLLAEAASLSQRGQWAAAEAACRRLLVRQPAEPTALHLLGVSLLQQGRAAQAEAALAACLKARPNEPAALANRGIALQALGRLDEALACYAQALALAPRQAATLNMQGLALLAQQRPAEALASFDRAIAAAPTLAEAWCNRADAHKALGHFAAEAADRLEALRLLGPSSGRLAAAAHALAATERGDEALALAEQALQLDADSIDAWSAKVAALSTLRRWNDVVAAYERMNELDPNTIEWRFGRAAALTEAGRPEEAVVAFNAALERQPDRALAINDRALALGALGRYDEAFADFARAEALDPALPQPHWHESIFRLLLGQFDIGWRKYEWRWQMPPFRKLGIRYRQPRWTGAEDLDGRTILLYGEQGLGDVIQFCRYAPQVAARGARVILGVHPPLKALLGTLAGVHEVVGNGEPLPPFDLQCPLLSLPNAFGTRVETIPSAVPYLRADADRVDHWARRLGARRAGLRVGLAWSGDPRLAADRRRSVPVDRLAPLLELPAEFYCLSKIVRDGDEAKMREFAIRHYGGEQTDFAETAALTCLMDLVISVDTSIAHLAGALARPLWLLIPDPPEYRWMLDREDSPWYPTARLFRQKVRGDWDEVIRRVAAELARLVDARAGSTS